MAERSHSGDLDLDQALNFERRAWTVERVARVIMVLTCRAAMTGLLGPGPLSKTTVGEQGGPLWIEYSRFGRFKAPLTLRAYVVPDAGRQGALRLWLSREYLEGVRIEQVSPQLGQVEAGLELLTYVFARSEPQRSTAVSFALKTAQIGNLRGCMGPMNGLTMCFRQFIYP
jgi:hypothetical protein